MESVKFDEVNATIAKDQPEYRQLHAWIRQDLESRGYFRKVTACFKLSEDELKNINEKGEIWFTVLQPHNQLFNPVIIETLKPEL